MLGSIHLCIGLARLFCYFARRLYVFESVTYTLSNEFWMLLLKVTSLKWHSKNETCLPLDGSGCDINMRPEHIDIIGI